jgi:SAM-dependent methyltransferase
MVVEDRRMLGRVFDEVPGLCDRVRPGYPAALFWDLADITGIGAGSDLLEVGCGTGQATRQLAELAGVVAAVEPGDGMADLARHRLADLGNVHIERSAFEAWEDARRRFDAVVAASSWHWVDPAVGWRRAHDVLRPGAWLVMLGHIFVRRPGEAEVYAETADVHERFAPGDPDWGDPPFEDDVRATDQGWGPLNEDHDALFSPAVVRWYPTVQWLDGQGVADLLRTLSPYRKLAPEVREPLLDAVADRIRSRLGDSVLRRHLTVLRVGQRLN